MLSFDTITFALKCNVVNVILKFADACVDATGSNSEVQMQWNKKSYLGK